MQLDKTENLWYNRSMEMYNVHKKKRNRLNCLGRPEKAKNPGTYNVPVSYRPKRPKNGATKKISNGGLTRGAGCDKI